MDVCTGENSIYRVQYNLRFQAPTAGLGMDSPQIRGATIMVSKEEGLACIEGISRSLPIVFQVKSQKNGDSGR